MPRLKPKSPDTVNLPPEVTQSIHALIDVIEPGVYALRNYLNLHGLKMNMRTAADGMVEIDIIADGVRL